MRKLSLLIVGLLLVNSLLAQINSPKDPALSKTAAENHVMSSDDMSMKNYRGAANSLHWLMSNTPEYFEGMYINAYKAYEQLANRESDAAKKKVLLDSMLISYRLKGEYFTLSDREKNNLAFKYYKYLKKDKSKIKEALQAYHDAYTYPENVINNNIVAYMDILRRYIKFGNEVSTNEIFEVFDQVTEVIEIKRQQGVSKKKLDQYSKIVNEILTSIIGNDGVDCKFIEENFGPGLDTEENFEAAKRVFTLMLNNECTDSPYYIKSAEILWSTEPTAGIAKILARFHAESGELDLAAEWYEKAIGISDTDEKKARIKMSLANVYVVNGEKSKARATALAAIKLDKEVSINAYNLIGNLYYYSFNDCKKSTDKFKDYSIFMAAYDMYEKAGNKKGMNDAKAQFPTVSERHTENRTEGETIKINCWLNTSTTLKTRTTN